jgi:hypothetical protein
MAEAGRRRAPLLFRTGIGWLPFGAAVTLLLVWVTDGWVGSVFVGAPVGFVVWMAVSWVGYEKLGRWEP